MTEFKVGDKVRCIKETPIPEPFRHYGHYTCYVGQICTVCEVCNENLLKIKTEDTYISFQDKNSFELVEEKEMEKEEFKVDKLGYYERKDGEKVKVIHICSDIKEQDHKVIAINHREDLFFYNPNGLYRSGNYEIDYNLIKYLGPELPREPRKFESISRCYSFKNQGRHKLIYKDDFLIDELISYDDNVKFKVTFEEIIDEV